jgi:Asp-tRNA(Asn)/Glu-tRNA(Gln) amidotransferase C subunit
MSLSADDVAKIAHLARLAVDPQASTALGRELSNISSTRAGRPARQSAA